MAESDSDLEIIEELPSQHESTPRNYVFDAAAASDDDELLDLDYNDDIVVSKTSGSSSSFGRRSKSSKNSKSSAKKMPLKTKEVLQIILSDDEDYADMEKKGKRGSDATEMIDDDLESLPSIPPPSPPPSSSQKAVYDNKRKYGVMDVGSDPYPIYPSSSSSTATTITKTTGSSKGSSQNSFFADLEAQEVDNLFQDAEYASLADFLAETGRKKTRKSPDNSEPFSFDKKAGKSSSKGIPSFSEFSCRQEETLTASKSKVRAKPAAKTRSTEEIVNEIQESYQVNKKSSNRSRAKKKDKENTALSAGATSGSSSAANVPTSSVDSQGQGKLKKPKDALKVITNIPVMLDLDIYLKYTHNT